MKPYTIGIAYRVSGCVMYNEYLTQDFQRNRHDGMLFLPVHLFDECIRTKCLTDAYVMAHYILACCEQITCNLIQNNNVSILINKRFNENIIFTWFHTDLGKQTI